ncbi:MAG: phosphoribosylamine--glycine ligase [Candidatus Stahlbacteria bacterium]|nr:phosphoribosylamine--glycine ligase [Candidatus Stahlbacteria bacterium]
MKVLVVGSGGREHAIVWKLAQSTLVDKIYALPGNGGMKELAECVPISDMGGIIKFANNVDLVIVGPEILLAEGLINELPKNKGFGPTKEAATIESDKSYAKELIRKVGIPTADFNVFTTLESATTFIDRATYPIVIKASGLAAGKGVFIIKNISDAIEVLNKIMTERIFGDSGNRIIIEEYLGGEEVSVIAFTDGKDFIPLLPCQDHKKLLDKDKGPNTGGMGAYTPAVLTSAEVGKVIENIFAPCVWGIRKEGIVYKGVLYAGLIITSDGLKVLEFNCRFGDPETQPVIKLLESDLIEPILAVIEGNLKSVSLKWHPGYATCVVLASDGYPDKYEKGKEITGLEKVQEATVFHAGTKKEKDKIITSGGRVLGVTGIGKTLKDSIDITYNEVSKIHFDKMYYRKDIGSKNAKFQNPNVK